MDALMGKERDHMNNPDETGSQCSDLRMGVIRSYLHTLIRILASLFWMYYNFCKLLPGILMRSALQ